ncbi:MAG: response regulator [Planctomycetota bacterium]|nr:response regulator [Planctomycetota bacterium]
MPMGDDPCRILIVEDEEAHAELIRRAFALRGSAKGLAVAGTLTEARAYLARSRPDLVIADLLLPDGKGTELLDGDGAGVAYPLVVLTAHGDEQAAVDAMKAGALDYIVKSDVTFADMPRIADRALRQWQDITERKRAEEERREYQQRLRRLAAELVQTEERERRRLAANLHDEVGQTLAAAKMMLQALEQRAAGGADLAEPLARVRELVAEAVEHTRSTVFDLSPPVLHELGLAAALESLVERTRNLHGISVTLEEDGPSIPLSEEVRVVLYRSVRELLHNVVRHAAATRAAVAVRRDDDHIRVVVEDDGVGFEPDAVRGRGDFAGGFGLFDIRERFDYLGGSVDIRSAPEEGTRVTLTAPLEPAD